jgi:hypothetical protein
MKPEAKLVTSKPEPVKTVEKKPLDPNSPAALPGLTRQHLKSQQGKQTNRDQNKKH